VDRSLRRVCRTSAFFGKPWLAMFLQFEAYFNSVWSNYSTFDLRAILQKRDISRATSHKMEYKNGLTRFKIEKGKYVSKASVSLKLFHNSNKNVLQISISAMPAVEASLTLSFLYQYQYVSGSKSETIDQCFVCHAIYVFGFDLLHSRKCSPLSHM